MPTATSFDTPLDNRGYPYEAVRPRQTWRVPLQASNLPVGPFLATTKVVRCVVSTGSFGLFLMRGVAIPLIIGAQPQDFIVYPGDIINVALLPGSAPGNFCITELI